MRRRRAEGPRKPKTKQTRKQLLTQTKCAIILTLGLNFLAGIVVQERKEAEKWGDGAKSAKNDKEEKRKAELARKAEAARLLAEEEAAQPAKVKAAPKAGAKKVQAKESKPAGPGAIAAGGGLGGPAKNQNKPAFEKPEEPESFHATGLDNALDLLEVVTAKMDKASVGTQAAGIDTHPEVSITIVIIPFHNRLLT